MPALLELNALGAAQGPAACPKLHKKDIVSFLLRLADNKKFFMQGKKIVFVVSSMLGLKTLRVFVHADCPTSCRAVE
ncbi:hypothetical protein KAR91_35505 [Candidatus Pacearchaeota archaeon]|nr:hypothetical protein [Candidatus Pacearchaeota archaeon]